MTTPIPSELEQAPQPLGRPPTVTRLQVLPIQELTWDNFEKLCLRLSRHEADISECLLYGTRGQDQSGIDFIGYPRNGDQSRVHCYQCKNVANFGPTDIESAIDKFLKGNWVGRTSKLVLCVRISLASTQQVQKLAEQRARLAALSITFETWEGGEGGTLTERLKAAPALVDDFFGREWVEAFNGEDVSQLLADRLDGETASTLRGRLRVLYETLFSRHDPGTSLVPGLVVPHLDRYIPTDIVERSGRRWTSEPAPTQTELPTANVGTEGAEEGQSLRRRDTPSRLAFDIETRFPVASWITASSRSVVLGDPGMGKSAFLRFIALALLHGDGRFPELMRVWGDRFPVWVSFGAWTEEIARDNSVSLEDFVSGWLHRNSADDITALFLRAMHDERLLLLVDGLDEGLDEASSRKALDRLHAFLSQRGCPSVLTSRLRGFDRVQIGDDWAIGRLADLTDKQVRQLAEHWYRHLISHTGGELRLIEDTVKRQVDEFCRELALSARIADLSRTPLLCLLLIEVKRHAGRIPENRFKAYERITQFLISEHPELRRQAAESSVERISISPDDTIEALTALAWQIQSKHRSGFAPRTFCAEVLEGFLRDDVQGPGLASPEAKRVTKLLLQHVRGTLGLLVERGRDELGFFHLTLQEYLAARALTRKSSDAQVQEVVSRAQEAGWHEVVVAWFGIQGVVHRNRDLTERAAKDLEAACADRPIARFHQMPLLAELCFGDASLPPRYALELAKSVLEEIERCPFPSLQRELSRWAILGLRSPRLEETVKQTIATWYPARYSSECAEMISLMREWKRKDGVFECLQRGLYSNSEDTQAAAAQALATSQFEGAKDWLFKLSQYEVNPMARAAALETIVEQWPSDERVQGLIANDEANNHPDLKFCAVEGRVKLQLHRDQDFDVLWQLRPYGSGLSWRRRYRMPETIVIGWQDSQSLRKKMIEVVHDGRSDHDDRMLALHVLANSYSQDDEIAEIVAFDIEGSQGRWAMMERGLWHTLFKNYLRHPRIVEGIENWIQERERKHPEFAKHMGPDESMAFAIVGTERVQERLLKVLRDPSNDQISKEWAVSSLEKGWSDFRFDSLFNEFKDKPIAEIAWFADIASKAVPASIRREWLLKVIANPQVRSIREACRAILAEWKDEEVLSTIITALDVSRWYYERKAIRGQLVRAFPDDARTVRLAEDLWSDPDGSDAGAIAALGDVNDGMRSRTLNAVAPARDELRASAMENMASGLVPSSLSISVLQDALFETNSDIACAGALALASAIADDEKEKPAWIERFAAEAEAIGFRMDVRNLTGAIGLLRLGEFDQLKTSLEKHKRFASFLDSDFRGTKVALKTEILRCWEALKEISDGSPWSVFGMDERYFWEAVSAQCLRFPEVRVDAMVYLRTRFGQSVAPGTLNLMAAYFPRDSNLLATCFATIQSPDHTIRSASNVALRIIGQHFGGDSEVREKLRAWENPHAFRRTDDVLLALVYGWPTDSLIEAFRDVRETPWRGMRFDLACHICRLTDNTEHMSRVIVQAMKRLSPDYFGMDLFVNALRLWNRGTGREELLESWALGQDASKAATAITLLAQSGSVAGTRRSSFESLFDRELANHATPRVGLDMGIGSRRPVADALYEAVTETYRSAGDWYGDA